MMTFEEKIDKTIKNLKNISFSDDFDELYFLNALDYQISCLKGHYLNERVFNKNSNEDTFDFLFQPFEVMFSFVRNILCLIAIKKNRTPLDVLLEIKNLLVSKNKKYGNAALEPIRIFAQADNVEQIKVRIDDKLNRIKQGHVNDDEDVLMDLLGYLILLDICTNCFDGNSK